MKMEEQVKVLHAFQTFFLHPPPPPSFAVVNALVCMIDIDLPFLLHS
jgi:hypothetical protein